MDHVSLDRPRPHDGDLNNDVIEFPGPKAGKHRHLCPAFDLEGAKRIRFADHIEDRRIVFLKRIRGQVEPEPLVGLQKLEGPPHATQHA